MYVSHMHYNYIPFYNVLLEPLRIYFSAACNIQLFYDHEQKHLTA